MSGYKENEQISFESERFLDTISLLLIEEAEEWSKSHSEAIRLLEYPAPTHQTVADFKSLLCERFSF